MKTRLKIIWKFSKLLTKSKELEREWQKHQQLMNDYEFSGPYNREKYLEQKGIVEGIQWCIKHFC
jgi:hypothetical protein